MSPCGHYPGSLSSLSSHCTSSENPLPVEFIYGHLVFKGVAATSQIAKFMGPTSMGPTWVLSAPYGPHVGPMNFAIRDNLWKGLRNSTATHCVSDNFCSQIALSIPSTFHSNNPFITKYFALPYSIEVVSTPSKRKSRNPQVNIKTWRNCGTDLLDIISLFAL